MIKVQWLKWFCDAGRAHLTKPGWNKPHTHSNPTNLALFRHKIHVTLIINTDHVTLINQSYKSTFTFFRLHGATFCNVHSEVSWVRVGIRYELAWYDLVRVRVDWKPSLVMSLSVDRQYRFTDNEIRAALNNVGNVVGVFPGTLVFPQVFQLLCTKPWMSVSCNLLSIILIVL